MKGKFIVFEGCDRCGKTTQINLLAQSLIKSGEKVIIISFPSRHTEVGKLIDKYLKNEISFSHEVAHLLFTANRWEMQESIKLYLSSGINVLCDRYYYSGVAYSLANGLDISWCIDTNDQLIEPDLVLYIEMDPEILGSRAGFGDERGESINFQKKVVEGYSYFMRNNYWNIINGNNTENSVSENILKCVLSKFPPS